MSDIFSLEFWTGIGFIIDFFLVILLLSVSRRVNRRPAQDASAGQGSASGGGTRSEDDSIRAARNILELLEPLVRDSKNAAVNFDSLITEKKRLIRELNEALDTRIININLLLSRAQTLQSRIETRLKEGRDLSNRLAFFPSSSNDDLNDQQTKIIDLYHQGSDIDTIAATLKLPPGEVRLVIDLKNKFQEMEKQSQ